MVDSPHKRPRRHQGEGSVRQRAEGWQASVTVDGVRLYHTASTEKLALRWARDTLAKAAEGNLNLQARNRTLGQLVTRWLEAKKGAIKPKTYQLYELTVRLHILPVLAAVKLHELTPDHLQTLYDSLSAHPRTVQNCHLILRQVLEQAATTRLLPYNFASATIPPRYQRPEMRTWTAEDARRFLHSVGDERWGAVYWLLLTTGLRVGELCGLRWVDVDMGRAALQVRRNVQRVGIKGQGTRLEAGSVKTDTPRTVELTDDCIGHLQAWQARQNLERMIAAEGWQESGFVISTRHGTPLEPRLVLRDFSRRVKVLGLPPISPHGLRHTCATLLLQMGTPLKVVQEILGHASPTITATIYAHATETMQQQATAATRKLYSLDQ